MAVALRSTTSPAVPASAAGPSLLSRYPVWTYFALTFAITWAAVVLVLRPGALPAAPDQRTAVGLAMLAGPSLASLLSVAFVFGRVGLREALARLRVWRVGWRWYAAAVLTAPLLTLAAATAVVLTLRSPKFFPTIDTTHGPAAVLLVASAGGLLIGFCEELGWTGFAVPRLRTRFGMVATGVIVGIPWGAWHFFMFWERDSFSGALQLALLLVRLFAWLPAYRVLMVWVYDRTGSLLIAVLMHASLAATTLTVAPSTTTAAAVVSIGAWAAALWLAVLALAISGTQTARR